MKTWIVLAVVMVAGVARGDTTTVKVTEHFGIPPEARPQMASMAMWVVIVAAAIIVLWLIIRSAVSSGVRRAQPRRRGGRMGAWVVLAAIAATSARADEKPKSEVDAEAFRAATERLRAKAAAQPDEVTRLKMEVAALKAEVAALQKEITTLRQAEADRKLAAEFERPGIFLFSWGSGPNSGPGSQLVRAQSPKDAIAKAKRMGIPLFLRHDVDGNEVVYTGMRRLTDAEVAKVKD